MPVSHGWGNFCAVNALMSFLLDLANKYGADAKSFGISTARFEVA